MPGRRIRCTALTIGVAGTCLLAACGSSSSGNGEAKKSGPQVAKDAAAALGSTNAVHVSGQIIDSTSKAPVTVDVLLESDGSSGTLTVSGQPIQLITVGGATYLKTTAAFYESQQASAAAAAKLANRWVKDPNTSDFSSFSLSGIAKDLAKPTNGTTLDQKVTTGKLNGQKVVIATASDGSKLYVAATGKPYPLQATKSTQSKNGSGTLKFTNYGQHETITAPAGAIDISSAGA